MRRVGVAILLALYTSAAFAADLAARDLREASRLLILVFGDSGTGAGDQREVGRHMAEECGKRGGCDLALMLGDNVYDAGHRLTDEILARRFEQPYAALGPLEFWPILGNHDWDSRALAQLEIDYSQANPRWRMPGYDYAIPLLPEWIRIYGLDTPSLLAQGDRGQVQRAQAWLCGGQGWKILFGHHPVYSSGWHGNWSGEYAKAKKPLLEPLIERCGVQFYLAGHDHHQEHLSAPQFEQIVQGAAARLRKVNEIVRRPPGVEQLAAAVEFGFALLEVTPTRAEVRFFGYSERKPYRNWHCRAYALADFADRTQRSQRCALAAR